MTIKSLFPLSALKNYSHSKNIENITHINCKSFVKSSIHMLTKMTIIKCRRLLSHQTPFVGNNSCIYFIISAKYVAQATQEFKNLKLLQSVILH